MHRDEFSYELPDERIAQTPLEPRDAARLLVDRGSRPAAHRHVHDLTQLLRPGDVLVVNDSRVIPARLHLRRRSGGRVEALLLEPRDPQRRRWEALMRPARKLSPGEVLAIDGEPGWQSAIGGEVGTVTVLERTDAGDTFEIELQHDHPADLLDAVGEMPLPPYITEPLQRSERYQTVYAEAPGSAAAPTAGLHFTPELMEQLVRAGIEIARVELIVGLDTFAPVTADDPRQHPIHTERYRVPEETMKRCAAAERVVAVGTTSVRALESAAATGDLTGRTDLFIHRGYEWQVVDLLMTNFHMPHTTLLMMIDAFVGSRWRSLYDEALTRDYRFLSFGDAMLLDRSAP